MIEYLQIMFTNIAHITNKLFLDCYAGIEEFDQFIETELKEPEPEEHHIDILDFDWDLV